MMILNKKGFKPPRVDRDTFIFLVRSGLDYDRVQGVYSIKNYNNIQKLTETIAKILNVDEVSFALTCALCGKDVECSDCKYLDSCTTKYLPLQCICPQCLREGKTFL